MSRPPVSEVPAAVPLIILGDPVNTNPDRDTLRDRAADAIWALYPDAEPSRTGLVLANPHAVADAVLAVLTDRAAILTEVAELAERLMDERYGPDCSYAIGGLDVARELRRLAAEAPTTTQPETEV